VDDVYIQSDIILTSAVRHIQNYINMVR